MKIRQFKAKPLRPLKRPPLRQNLFMEQEQEEEKHEEVKYVPIQQQSNEENVQVPKTYRIRYEAEPARYEAESARDELNAKRKTVQSY